MLRGQLPKFMRTSTLAPSSPSNHSSTDVALDDQGGGDKSLDPVSRPLPLRSTADAVGMLGRTWKAELYPLGSRLRLQRKLQDRRF